MAKFVRPLAAVTGASAGIGYELAKVFAMNGFDVIVVAEDESIHEVPSQLVKYHVEAESVQADLSKRKGVLKFYEKIKSMGRPLEAIAINAGVGTSGHFASETDLEEELNIVNLNCASVVHLSKLVVKDMVKNKKGKILYTSSVAATMPGPLLAVYAASKAFVQSFSQAIRNELQDTGVTVTALMPSATETDFFERANMEDTEMGQSEKDSAEQVAHQGFEAMMAGEAHVVGGGLMNKLEVALAKVTPETMKAAQYRKENEKVSSKKH